MCRYSKYFLCDYIHVIFNFALAFITSQNTKIESKKLFFCSVYSYFVSFDFIADQLCLRDNQRCPVLKMCVSELNRSGWLPISFAMRKLGYTAGSEKGSTFTEKTRVDSEKNSVETRQFRADFVCSEKRAFGVDQRCHSAAHSFSSNVRPWLSTDLAINSSVCLGISSE